MQAGLALQQAEGGRQTTTIATAAEAKCFSWFEQDHSSFGACTSPTTTAACTQRGGLLLPQACTRRGLPCSGMSMEMTIPLQRLSIPSRHLQQVQQSPCQKVKLISCPEGWEIHKQQPRAIAARNARKKLLTYSALEDSITV